MMSAEQSGLLVTSVTVTMLVVRKLDGKSP